MSNPISKLFNQWFSQPNAEQEAPQNHTAQEIPESPIPECPEPPPPLNKDTLEEWNSNEAAQAQTSESHSHIVSEAVPMSASTQSHTALQQALKEMIGQIHECEAIAYVDIDKEQLLAFESTLPFPENVRKLLASVTTDLFTMPNMIKVSNIFNQRKGLAINEKHFDEIIIHGDGDFYVFIRTQKYAQHIVVFSCNNHTTSAEALAQARPLMSKIEATL